ncbi:transposase [Schaalia naturae]
MPKAYPKEFREDVIRVARTSEAPLRQVAKDFGIAESCLRRWVHKAELAEDPQAPAVSESGELRALKRRNQVLEQENEILRRAAAFFAREISPK